MSFVHIMSGELPPIFVPYPVVYGLPTDVVLR